MGSAVFFMFEPQSLGWFVYQAHGESIQSRLPLPEYLAAPASGPHSLRIDCVPMADAPPSAQGFAELTEGGFRLWWQTTGDFHVSAQGHIIGWRPPGVSDALFRLPLLGTVLSAALAMRRRFVLHGNAVCINGRAFIIVGHKGQGKSTLTACLLQRGHRLIADDVSALTFDAADVSVHRGAFQLRLWPDSIERIFEEPAERFEQISASYPKRIVSARQFVVAAEHLPLAGILSLSDSEKLSLETLSVADAWKQAVVHSFHSRLGSAFLKTTQASGHHRQCARLVRNVKMYRLHRPRDFSRLEEVARFVEQAVA